MGRLARRYEREAVGWFAAAVQTVLVLPVVIVVVAAIGAAVLVLIAWGVLGTVIWLTGWAVAVVSKDAGRQVRAAGVQQLSAMEKAADEWTHPRRTKERRRAAALTARAAAEAQAQAERAAIEAPALAARAAAEAQAQAVALREWLEGPPPTLYVPRRFSEDWFADNVPKLHPAQVPALLDELRARGWTDQRIQQRLARYLALNQFWLAK
jgi:hypothetical protein